MYCLHIACAKCHSAKWHMVLKWRLKNFKALQWGRTTNDLCSFCSFASRQLGTGCSCPLTFSAGEATAENQWMHKTLLNQWWNISYSASVHLNQWLEVQPKHVSHSSSTISSLVSSFVTALESIFRLCRVFFSSQCYTATASLQLKKDWDSQTKTCCRDRAAKHQLWVFSVLFFCHWTLGTTFLFMLRSKYLTFFFFQDGTDRKCPKWWWLET